MPVSSLNVPTTRASTCGEAFDSLSSFVTHALHEYPKNMTRAVLAMARMSTAEK
jgi:hypothetical protein